MWAYLVRRLWQMVPTLLGVVLLVFLLFKFFGADPAVILGGLNATQEQVAAIRTQLGLDRPWWVQLAIYLKEIVTFDWGRSWATNESVAHLFATRLPATLTVMIPILILDTLVALPIAMWVAYRRGSLSDRTITVITTVALSISFLVYIIIGQYVFGFQLGWFPVQGWSDSTLTNLLTYVPLPVLLAVLVGISPQTRLYRTFVLDELGHDYVRTARAKGQTERVVIWRHALKNALLPVVTIIGLQFGTLLGGAILTETIFSWPGIGSWIYEGIINRDYPVVQGGVVFVALVFVLINLLVDLSYALLDPRIQYR